MIYVAIGIGFALTVGMLWLCYLDGRRDSRKARLWEAEQRARMKEGAYRGHDHEDQV